jgi:TPR repeat protein
VPEQSEIARLQAAAEAGDAEACNELGVCYRFGEGVPLDLAKAATLLSRAAEQGHVLATFNLGTLYLRGMGVEQDADRARELFQAAAEAGEARALNSLGNLCEDGNGMLQDDTEAARYYQLAAAQGHARAMVNLGALHEQGRGVAKDPQRALEFYQAAADLGSADGQNNLGVLYLGGIGVPRDQAKARLLFQAAADQGNALGHFNLGQVLRIGQGMAPDLGQALKHYRLAAEMGHKGAKAALQELEKPVRSLRPLGWLILLAAFAYPIGSWLTFSGPYRFFARLQLQLFDAFLPSWTVLGLLMASGALAALIIHRLPGALDERDSCDPDWFHRLLDRLWQFRFSDYALICLLIVAPFVILKLWDGLTAGALSQSAVSQIAAGSVPESRYVEIAGIPRFDWSRSTGAETLRSPVLAYGLFPLVSPGWKRGESIFVFVETFETSLGDIRAAFHPENDFQAQGGFDGRQRHERDANGVAMVRLRGLLHENALSGPMEEQLREAGLAIAKPYYVLDHTSSPEDELIEAGFLMMAWVGGLVLLGLICAYVRFQSRKSN